MVSNDSNALPQGLYTDRTGITARTLEAAHSARHARQPTHTSRAACSRPIATPSGDPQAIAHALTGAAARQGKHGRP